MAYMNQEKKAKLAPKIKEICKRYGIKATLSVSNHATLNLNVQSGKIDFLASGKRCGSIAGKDHVDFTVNPYWYHEHFDGIAKDFLTEVHEAMNVGNHDNSDIMTDYFDVGWYAHVNLGRWNKPYKLEA
jgi:hypothetical protein